MGKHYVFLIAAIAFFQGCASTSGGMNVEQKKGDIYLNAGVESLVKGDYTDALISLTEASRYSPKNPVVWNNMGIAYANKDQPAKAEEVWHKTLELDPKFTDARNNLGVLYLQQKRYKEADREFQLAIKDLLYPKAAQVHYNLSLSYSQQRKPLLAEQQLKLAVQNDNFYCPAWYRLGMLQKQRGDLEAAVASLKSSVSGMCYKNPEAHYEIGSIYLRARNIPDAKTKLLEVIELFPDSDWAKKAEITLNMIR